MTLTASDTSRWRLVVPTFLSSDEVKPEGRKDNEAVRDKTEIRTKEDKYVMK